MAFNIKNSRQPLADINVTPFVDVMLVLLVIFMVTAPMFSQGLPVNLPEAKARPMVHDQPGNLLAPQPRKLCSNPTGMCLMAW
jgi:biopolymer transport protein ExbD